MFRSVAEGGFGKCVGMLKGSLFEDAFHCQDFHLFEETPSSLAHTVESEYGASEKGMRSTIKHLHSLGRFGSHISP